LSTRFGLGVVGAGGVGDPPLEPGPDEDDELALWSVTAGGELPVLEEAALDVEGAD